MKKLLPIIVLGLAPLTAIAAGSAVPDLLAQYKSQGAADFSAERGKAMWSEKHVQKKSGEMVSCATCHGTDLSKPGSHAKTGKLIEAMSPSVNAERLTDPAKIEKWFLRNCKWTLGRECTTQEKGDFLTFIKNN
ncbi:MAG TPA: DUF1924 domain-containing protein [Mariprofundaceae bacterium]|nr:DUF1924 domain-containing protein [Mariprofundaceae bacterium]